MFDEKVFDIIADLHYIKTIFEINGCQNECNQYVSIIKKLAMGHLEAAHIDLIFAKQHIFDANLVLECYGLYNIAETKLKRILTIE